MIRNKTHDILLKSHKAYVLPIIVLKYSIPIPHIKGGQPSKAETINSLHAIDYVLFFGKEVAGCLGQGFLRSLELEDNLVIRGCFEDWRKVLRNRPGVRSMIIIGFSLLH